METNTLELTEQPEGLGFTSIRDLVNLTLNKDFGLNLPTEGVSSGFRELDKAIGGFQKGQVYTIAVKPGMGKTAFLLSITNNMAIKDAYAVAIFSSERSNIKMTNRLIESETGMSLDRLQSGKFKDSEKDHMLSLLSSIAKAKIYIDDTPALAVADLRKKARKLCGLHQVDLIIVDYLELLTTPVTNDGDPSVGLSGIMQEIKAMAAEQNKPVLLFSQSAGHTNGLLASSRPSIGSMPDFLKDGSDVLMVLHRNDVFPMTEPRRNVGSGVELIVTRTKDPGHEVIVPLHFIESIAKFADFS